MTVWDQHVMAALLLIRELRWKAVMHDLDPRALRVALKYALMIDTELMRKHGLTEEEDEKLTAIAEDLFKKTPRG